ncbi:hypothetical protein BZG36_00627 [Bifiguratus adelaidae]|uniref:Uncharacterized protein n=1 Tax=Bifiguratus adelaidae TaxID=1938954 RepID=A0A261Y7K7_9FUNG|nr:hypothetical protein BZG36_00627 [Bifiguratus adelaidae]
MLKVNQDGLLALEQPFVKVPYEQLKKSFRTAQKHTERDLASAATAVNNVLKSVELQESGSANEEEMSKQLDGAIAKLQSLKRKLGDVTQQQSTYLSRSKARLDHFNELSSITSIEMPEFQRWSRIRLNRILVDYLLRKGLNETAKLLAHTSDIEQMVDVELFAQSSRIEEALAKHSCTECLQWCLDNKSNLRKMKSTLEFNLRLQEFIEMVQAAKMMEALQYARKHLTPWAETHLKQIQQAMGLLAFKPDTQCAPYKQLYDSSRWNQLITEFRADNFALCSLTSQPLLAVTLQTGLSALKTPMCYQHLNRNINCPVCATDTLGFLAEKLPLSHHVNSTLVCRISNAIMNENNPPMALPNGMVYSYNALADLARKNDGEIKCPRTGLKCKFTDLKKVYIS